jgi:hypothetical protein
MHSARKRPTLKDEMLTRKLFCFCTKIKRLLVNFQDEQSAHECCPLTALCAGQSCPWYSVPISRWTSPWVTEKERSLGQSEAASCEMGIPAGTLGAAMLCSPEAMRQWAANLLWATRALLLLSYVCLSVCLIELYNNKVYSDVFLKYWFSWAKMTTTARKHRLWNSLICRGRK